MKAFFSLLLTFGAIFVCNFTTDAAYDDSQAVAAYPYLMLEPAIQSIDNLYRAILGLYRSCIVALRKYFSEKLQEARNGTPPTTVAFGGLYKFQVWREQNNHYTGTLQEMVFYMQREVNEAETNIEIIIKYFNGLADGTIPPPKDLSPRTVQIIITLWVELRDSLDRLSYDIDVFRSFITAKIDSLMYRFGEGTFELHAGMKTICHEVDMRSQYWIKIVGSAFRKALALPEASYYIVSLELFYAEWPALFVLPPEATVVEFLVQSRAITNTIHNAAQVNFFLSASMRLKGDTWPYLNLIFQDSANIKRFVDRGFARIESFIRCSLNSIQEQLQAENYDQADSEMQNVKEQVESDVKVFVDFTETSYRRIYDASYAEYFDVYATDLRYTDAFQNLLWYLVEQGFPISWPENEFAPLNERIMIVSLSDTNYPGVTQYSKSNFRSIVNADNAGNDSKYLQMSLNAYHLILHENLLHGILSSYRTLLNNLKNTLPQNDASKAILLNLKEDAILFAQGFQYLQLYVSQSGLFIDWVHVETVEEYMNLLIKLDLDILHRIDILCYRVLSTFKRAIDYMYFVNSQPPPEEIPVQNTDVTTREFTDIPPTGNPVMGNIFHINAPPSFWIERGMQNSHGKLPYYVQPPVVAVTTPTIIPAIPVEEFPGQYTPNEGIVEEILPVPPNIPQITTSPPTGITPRTISNDVEIGKKLPVPQSRPTQPTGQNPINSANGIVPEIIAGVPNAVENIPNEEIPISPTPVYVPTARFLNEWPFGKRIKTLPRSYHPNQIPISPTPVYVPTARFLNEWPFGKRIKTLPRSYHPTIQTPQLLTNPAGVIPEENIIEATEPILPIDNYVRYQNPGGFSSAVVSPSPGGMNIGNFGKIEDIPRSLPQPTTYSPPTEMSGQIPTVGVNIEPQGVIPSAVVSPSPGGMNMGNFGRIEDIPRSLPQPTTYSPPTEMPAEIPIVESVNMEPQGVTPSAVVSPSPGGMNMRNFGRIEDIPRSLPQPVTYTPPTEMPAQIPTVESVNMEPQGVIPSAVVSPSPGGMNMRNFGRIEDIPSSLPQPTTYSPPTEMPAQIPAVESVNTEPQGVIPSAVVSPSPGGMNMGNFGRIEDIPRSLPQPVTYTPPTEMPAEIPAVESVNIEPQGVIPSAVVSPSPGGMNMGNFGRIEDIPRSLPQPVTYTPPTEMPAEIPAVESVNIEPQGVIPSAVVSPSPGGMNMGNFGRIEDIPRSLPQPTTYTPPTEMPGQIPAVENINEGPEGEFIPATDNTNEIPGEEYALPAVATDLPAETYIPPTANNETLEEENILPTVTGEIPAEGYALPTADNNLEEDALPAVTDEIPEEDFSSSDSEMLEEPGQSLGGSHTQPNEEEIAAALDLLSSVYEPLDMNSDGSADILIINPEEANAGLFGGYGMPQGTNGPTTITLDQNTSGWRERESTLEGSGYFDESGFLQGGNISGTQHEESEINSNSLGLVDLQSDGVTDMTVENATNQTTNEDTSFVVLGDLDPTDGMLTNTVLQTSLTTQEETSMTTYILGEEQPPLA